MMEESAKRPNTMDVGDRISGLHDDLLHRVLSLLPARDAVRTCVLSPRWHNLWASARRLNVDAVGFHKEEKFLKFVKNLLLRRGHAPLDTFWRANGRGIFLHSFSEAASLWICHALRCNVQELGIVDHDQWDISGEEEDVSAEEEDVSEEEEWHPPFRPDRYSFTSSHLKKLHLCYVRVDNRLTKQLFSGCPELEDLEMINCIISATEFSSTTLKNLSIDYVNLYPDFYAEYDDIVINMPSLVSLRIGELICRMPSLVDVQSLVTASITLKDLLLTFANHCQILGALSDVKNLVLLFPCFEGMKHLSGSEMLSCQVVFTNLTTLSLDDWCLYGGCRALLYVLKHSPNLLKLTLNLHYKHRAICCHPDWSPNAAAELYPPCKETETPFNCKKLKKIEINCPYGDKRAGIVVAILCANKITLPEINIKFRW